MSKNKLKNCWLPFSIIIALVGMGVAYPATNSPRIIVNSKTVLLVLTALVLLIGMGVCNRNLKVNKWILFWNSVISIIYSSILVIGRAYEARGNLSLIWASHFDFWCSILSWLSYSILLFYLFLTIYHLTVKYQLKKVVLAPKNKIKFCLLIFLLLLVLALPYFVVTFPGLAGFDGMRQMDELFRQKTTDGAFSLTNHHPIFSTLLQGLFIKVGISCFHSINAGILLNSIFLNLLTIASFSLLITIVALHFNKYVSIILAVFFGSFPAVIEWANGVDKTGYFVAFFILFLSSLLLLDIRQNSQKQFAIWLFVISGILLSLTRNDGIVYVLFAMLGSLPLNGWKKIWLGALIVIVLAISFSKALTVTTRALPTEPMESLSIPMQQLARVVRDNPKSLTRSEKRQLNRFFDYSKLASAYNPEFADNVKDNARWPYDKFVGNYQQRKRLYDNQQFVKNKGQFWKLWFEVGKKNKRIYLEALVGQNIFYLYPQNHLSYFFWILGPNAGNKTVTDLFAGYHLKDVSRFYQFAIELKNASEMLVIGWLFISFTWFSLWLLPSIMLIDQQRFNFLNLVMIGGAIVLISLASPVNGYLRYTMPLIILDPFLWIGCFQQRFDAGVPQTSHNQK